MQAQLETIPTAVAEPVRLVAEPAEEQYRAWAQDIDRLLASYREVERRSLNLPSFSVSLYLRFLWGVIVFCAGLLVLPVQGLVWLYNRINRRHPLPKIHTRTHQTACRLVEWVWNGEVPTVPVFVTRGLVGTLLAIHFRNRLHVLRRCIQLDDTYSQAQQEQLLAKLDTALQLWQPPTFQSILYAYAIPIISPMIALYHFISPSEQPEWMGSLIYLLSYYSLSFLITAALVKRGLLLGGTAGESYYPGWIAVDTTYKIEDKVFAAQDLQVASFRSILSCLLPAPSSRLPRRASISTRPISAAQSSSRCCIY